MNGLSFGFLAVAVVANIAAAGVVIEDMRFRSSGLTAQGEVIALEPSGDTVRGIVRFAVPSGEEYQVRAGWTTKPPAFDVGEFVEVRYHADDPGGARIDSFIEKWGLPLLLAALSVPFALAGGWLSVRVRRAKRR